MQKVLAFLIFTIQISIERKLKTASTRLVWDDSPPQSFRKMHAVEIELAIGRHADALLPIQ